MRGRLLPPTQTQVIPRTPAPSSSTRGDLTPSLAICTGLLRSCIHRKTLISGHILHDSILKCGHHHAPAVAAFVLQLYLTCGAFTDALRWFLHIPVRSACSWNLLIGFFVQQGQLADAIDHYRFMLQDGVAADQVTYVHTLSACQSIEECRKLHADIRASGFDSDIIVGTALVTTFGRLHSLEDVKLAFDGIFVRNIVSWNAMMSAQTENGHGCKVSFLFHQSQQESLLPDNISVLNMLTAHARNHHCQLACKILHVLAICGGFNTDNVMGTAMICAYGSCGLMSNAALVFQEMEGRAVVTWNVIIRLHVHRGCVRDAFAAAHQMQVEGIFADNVTFITLLDACAKEGDVEKGKKLHLSAFHIVSTFDIVLTTAFISMYGKCGILHMSHLLFNNIQFRNTISWNAIISAHAQLGCVETALLLFYQMQHEALIPNKLTLIEVFSACASQAALSVGKKIHSCMLLSSIDMDDEVNSSLISMYGKCGNAKDARAAFDQLCCHKRSSWNALIATYAQLGEAIKAIQLLEKMTSEGVGADDITLVSILAACSHGGMLDEGLHYFVWMQKVQSLGHDAEHYDCILDLLCRAGLYDIAGYVIEKMPIEPSIISWTSLLCTYGIGMEV